MQRLGELSGDATVLADRERGVLLMDELSTGAAVLVDGERGCCARLSSPPTPLCSRTAS